VAFDGHKTSCGATLISTLQQQQWAHLNAPASVKWLLRIAP
jgi:hypothetical protein